MKKDIFFKACMYIIGFLFTFWALLNIFIFVGESIFLEEELNLFLSSERYDRMENLLVYSFLLIVLIASLKLIKLISPFVLKFLDMLISHIKPGATKEISH